MWQCFFMWRDTANDISNKLSTNEQLVADSLTQHWSRTSQNEELQSSQVFANKTSIGWLGYSQEVY